MVSIQQHLLNLRVTQNALQQSFFSYSLQCLWTNWQKLLSKFIQLFFQRCVTQIQSPSLGTPTNFCVYVRNFCVYEHVMPCALEGNSNDRSKQRQISRILPFNRSKHHISITTMCMAPKIGRMVTYHGGLSPIKSNL